MFVRSLPVYPVAVEGFVVGLSMRPTKRAASLEEHRIALEVCSTFRDLEESARSKVFKTRDLPGVKSRRLVARVDQQAARAALLIRLVFGCNSRQGGSLVRVGAFDDIRGIRVARACATEPHCFTGHPVLTIGTHLPTFSSNLMAPV